MGIAAIIRRKSQSSDMPGYNYDGRLKDVGVLVLSMGKSLVRGTLAGAMIGTAAGTVCSVVSGSNISQGAVDGASIGAVVGAHIGGVYGMG